MVWKLVSNNCYSVMIKRKSYGFFKSTRRMKQGDPLFPTMFIIGEEVLSRGLNKLNKDVKFLGYGLRKCSPKINHLAHANDIILFDWKVEIP